MSVDDDISEGGNGEPPRNEPYRKASLAALVALVTIALGLHLRWLLSKSLTDAATQASGWLKDLSGPHLSAYALIFSPFLVLLSALTVVLVQQGLPTVWKSVRRSALLGLLLGACVFGAALLASGKLRGLTALHWLFFVPMVPPVLLGFQALIVWRQRPRSLGRFSPGVSIEAIQALEKDGSLDRFKRLHSQLLRVFGGRHDPSSQLPAASRGEAPVTARSETGAAYQAAYFVTNFAVPGLLLLLVGFGALSLAWEFPAWPTQYLTPEELKQLGADLSAQKLAASLTAQDIAGRLEVRELVQRGLRWGVAGAFAYVLIEFGGRFFRNDLTVGAAIWSIITLLVGPALAVVLSVAWKMEAGASPWQTGAVLFFAGLAPRRVVTIVESVALQFLKTPSEAATPPKLMPLTGLRGVTSEVALRLREENVQDVNGLAYADAIRLVQSLPYDLRQIVDWIDQAQLALALPKHYETLRDNGVTGAIDLAWRWLRLSVHTTEDGSFIRPSEAPPDSFKLLVNQVDQDARLVYDTAAQLFYEEQVCLLWVMYNCFSTTTGGVDLSFDEDARAQTARPEQAQPPALNGGRPREMTPPPMSHTQLKPAAEPPAGEVQKK